MAPSEIRKPDRVDISTNGSTLTMAYDWDRRVGQRLLGTFAVAIACLAVAVIYLLERKPWGVTLLLILVPLLVLLGASAAAHLFNTTRVTADFDEIRVDVGPVASRGLNKTFRVADLEQIGVRNFRHGTDQDGSRDSKVMAHARGGEPITLVNGVPERAVALFIEQELERHLEIQNRATGDA